MCDFPNGFATEEEMEFVLGNKKKGRAKFSPVQYVEMFAEAVRRVGPLLPRINGYSPIKKLRPSSGNFPTRRVKPRIGKGLSAETELLWLMNFLGVLPDGPNGDSNGDHTKVTMIDQLFLSSDGKLVRWVAESERRVTYVGGKKKKKKVLDTERSSCFKAVSFEELPALLVRTRRDPSFLYERFRQQVEATLAEKRGEFQEWKTRQRLVSDIAERVRAL